jgi:hypothetical protein
MYYRVEDFRIKTVAALVLASTTSILLAFASLIG